MNYYCGIDFGTSGARAIVIDRQRQIVAESRFDWDEVASQQLVQIWQSTLFALIASIALEVRENIKAIAINGTSSTVLLCDAAGNPLAEPLLYNDSRGRAGLRQIKAIAPDNHVVISATSSLSKLFWWQQQPYFQDASYLMHQADWLAYLLHGKLGISDYHNALKLGYDVDDLRYPDWLQKLPFNNLYPQVLTPGTPIDTVTSANCDRLKLPADCIVKTGTTDSIAAFLASGASQPGEAVTSLGSTLVLKLLSRTKVSDSKSGVYSHRLGEFWLAGGASNTGGAVLQHFFDLEQLQKLSLQIDPTTTSPLRYYPLLQPGDRFPFNDPELLPRLTPRPSNDVDFLHGLLAGISRIEKLGYQKLQEMGSDRLTRIYTAGGGAKNAIWSKIRQHCLQVPVLQANQTEAAYGTALLAADALILGIEQSN